MHSTTSHYKNYAKGLRFWNGFGGWSPIWITDCIRMSDTSALESKELTKFWVGVSYCLRKNLRFSTAYVFVLLLAESKAGNKKQNTKIPSSSCSRAALKIVRSSAHIAEILTPLMCKIISMSRLRQSHTTLWWEVSLGFICLKKQAFSWPACGWQFTTKLYCIKMELFACWTMVSGWSHLMTFWWWWGEQPCA